MEWGEGQGAGVGEGREPEAALTPGPKMDPKLVLKPSPGMRQERRYGVGLVLQGAVVVLGASSPQALLILCVCPCSPLATGENSQEQVKVCTSM